MNDSRHHAEVALEVPFHDVDPVGFVWHGHYPKYLEAARSRLLSGIGFGFHEMRASGYAWPVVDMQLRYIRPLRCEQRVIVAARVTEYENRLRVAYEIRDADSGERLTRAETVQVAMEMDSGEMSFVTPPVLLEKLGVGDLHE